MPQMAPPMVLKFPVSLELTATEVTMAWQIAAFRNWVTLTQNNGSDAGKVDPSLSSVEVNWIGVMGEIAFCMLANCMPDLSFHYRVGGDDCVLHNGVPVDVKTATGIYADTRLFAKPSAKPDTFKGIYVLAGIAKGMPQKLSTTAEIRGKQRRFTVYEDPCTITCLGWCWSADLFHPNSYVEIQGKSPHFEVAASNMHTNLPLFDTPTYDTHGRLHADQGITP